MAIYAELETEPQWGREFEPPSLRTLTNALRAHYGVGFNKISAKGDNRHLKGYHRSREWIRKSRFSARGAADKSIQLELDRGGDDRWLCAIDVNPGNQGELIAMCQRLDVAVRAGMFSQLREWFGNLGGDNEVDGWDNVKKVESSANDSHLTHLHISFFRGRADVDHSELLAVLIGDDMWTRDQINTLMFTVCDDRAGGPIHVRDALMAQSLARLEAAVGAIAERVDLDPAELERIKNAASSGAAAGVAGSLDLLAAAIAAELRKDGQPVNEEAVTAAVRRVLQ